MESYLIVISIGIGSLLIGFIIGVNSRKGKNKSLLEDLKREGQELLQKARIEAEAIKKDKVLEAKEHFIELEKITKILEKKIKQKKIFLYVEMEAPHLYLITFYVILIKV